MKLIKGILLTLFVVVILLPLTGVLLMYSPDEQLPEAYRVLDGTDAQSLDALVDSLTQDLSWESMDKISLPEDMANLFIQAYIAEGIAPRDEYTVNYAYVDFVPGGFTAAGHVTLKKGIEFPVKISLDVVSELEDGIETLTLEGVRLGKLPVPMFAIRQVLKRVDQEMPYVDKTIPAVSVDLNEIITFTDWVEIIGIDWTDDAIEVSWDLNIPISATIMESAVEAVETVLDEVNADLDETEKESVEVILEIVQEMPVESISEIPMEEAAELMEAFDQLQPDTQEDLIEAVMENMDPEDMEEFQLMIQEMMGN